MPVVPNFLERFFFLRLNLAPAPTLDLVGAGVFRSVVAASNLGLFEALKDRPKTVAELAAQINVSETGLAVLLDLLVESRYLKRIGSNYACTAMTRKWLLQDSPSSLAPFVTFFHGFAFPFMDAHLEESVRLGKPSSTLYESLDQTPGGWKAAQDWFLALARVAGDEIVSKAKLPSTTKRLLDIGGGHGLYSVKFCQRYPGLSATVFDQPEPVKAARETIVRENMTSRVSVTAGDFSRDDFDNGYDAALLFNIIHGLKPDENIILFKKVVSALNPQGRIVIWEQLAERTSPNAVGALVRFLGLTYLAALGGQVYKYEEVAGWLASAGLVNLRRVKLRRSPGSSLIIATKAA